VTLALDAVITAPFLLVGGLIALVD
jgi:hypothetical protein